MIECHAGVWEPAATNPKDQSRFKIITFMEFPAVFSYKVSLRSFILGWWGGKVVYMKMIWQISKKYFAGVIYGLKC